MTISGHPYVVGLTGGIGAGKSTVSDRFADLGIEIVDTDLIARQVVAPGSAVLESIAAEFGRHLLTADGALDRKALRSLVFDDDSLRNRLEAITHPAIRQRAMEAVEAARSPYVMLVVPLLLETGFDELVSRVLVVDARESEQLERLMARDGTPSDLAQRMINSQMPRNERLRRAHDIIDNTDNGPDLDRQIGHLHVIYGKLAGHKP